MWESKQRIIYSPPWVSNACRCVEVESRSWTYESCLFIGLHIATISHLKAFGQTVHKLRFTLLKPIRLSTWLKSRNNCLHELPQLIITIPNCRHQNYHHLLPNICLTSPLSNHAQLPLLNSAVNQYNYLCSLINTNSLNLVPANPSFQLKLEGQLRPCKALTCLW